jgi:carbonic anhydrase
VCPRNVADPALSGGRFEICGGCGATVVHVSTEISQEPFAPNADELLTNNARYVESFADHDLALSPRRRLAIVACMDSRMDIFEMLGLAHGDAHIIRNAGGVVTDDVIRSLVLSQRLLGTREIILLHHTDCGLQQVVGDALIEEIEAETGIRPAWSIESFKDPFQDVRQSIRRLQVNPFISFKEHVRGFVYQVADGRLVETTL